MTFGKESSPQESWEQLDHYVAAGGNLLDTADSYGAGTSEEIVGEWLARVGSTVRDDLVVATKGRFPTGPGPNGVGLSRKHLAAALDASLCRLQVDTIDLYQTHAWDPWTPPEETLEFLTAAVRAGKVHYVGLSNVTGWQLQRLVGLSELHRLVRPVAVQPQYNLLSREVEWEILPAAAANGLAVLPWSPLAGGWLTGKYAPDAAPTEGRLGAAPAGAMNAYARRSADRRTWDVVETVRAVAQEHDVPMARVALAWVLSRPEVTSVVLGARTVTHLADNLAALELVLSAEELARLDAASDPAPADYPYGELGREQRTRRLQGGR